LETAVKGFASVFTSFENGTFGAASGVSFRRLNCALARV